MFKCQQCGETDRKPNLVVTAVRPVQYQGHYNVSEGFETVEEKRLCSTCCRALLNDVDWKPAIAPGKSVAAPYRKPEREWRDRT